MALALDATYSNTAGGGGSNVVSVSVTYATGDTVVVWCASISNVAETLSLSDGGTNTYTVKTPYARNITNNNHSGVMAIAQNVTGGSFTLTGTWNGTSTYADIYVWRISGAATSSYDVNDATDGSSTIFSPGYIDVGPITTTQADEILLIGASNLNSRTWSFNSGFTLDNDGSTSNGRGGAGHKIVSAIQTALTVRATTSATSDGVAGIMAVKAVGAPPAASVAPRDRTRMGTATNKSQGLRSFAGTGAGGGGGSAGKPHHYYTFMRDS